MGTYLVRTRRSLNKIKRRFLLEFTIVQNGNLPNVGNVSAFPMFII